MEQTGASDIQFVGTQRNCELESRQLGPIQDSNPNDALFEPTPNQARRIPFAGMLAVYLTITAAESDR